MDVRDQLSLRWTPSVLGDPARGRGLIYKHRGRFVATTVCVARRAHLGLAGSSEHAYEIDTQTQVMKAARTTAREKRQIHFARKRRLSDSPSIVRFVDQNPDYAQAGAVVTASLRAAVAWSRREDQPGVWREISRMLGVLAFALGPGCGPTSPVEFIRSLHRPLMELAPVHATVAGVSDLVLLDHDDQLTAAAIEIGCDFNHALFETADPGKEWLPTWAWQTAEQVERAVFENLIRSVSDAEYSVSRRFLIENPAGDERLLTDKLNVSHARRAAKYEPIPADRSLRAPSGTWWWPCPVCRWPMRVKRGAVSCTYSLHGARFRLSESNAGDQEAPRLTKLSSARWAVPIARPADNARCVELSIWRFIVVPGVPELELERRLSTISGVTTTMWPNKDRVDLIVRMPGGLVLEVDVKDHTNPITIAASNNLPNDVVVPDYRRAQLIFLRRVLPTKRVSTVTGFVRHVRAQIATA